MKSSAGIKWRENWRHWWTVKNNISFFIERKTYISYIMVGGVTRRSRGTNISTSNYCYTPTSGLNLAGHLPVFVALLCHHSEFITQVKK